MADPRRPEDIRDTESRSGPRTGAGDGAAYGKGYGAGGLGSGAPHEKSSWHAPGVTPAGERTGSTFDGPRSAMDEEGEPDPDLCGRTPPDDDTTEKP